MTTTTKFGSTEIYTTEPDWIDSLIDDFGSSWLTSLLRKFQTGAKK